MHHRDPFDRLLIALARTESLDRLLIALARTESLALVTIAPPIHRYDVETL